MSTLDEDFATREYTVSDEDIGLVVTNGYGEYVIVGVILEDGQFNDINGNTFWRCGWRLTDKMKQLTGRT